MLLPLKPNYDRAIRYSLSFETDIFQRDDGLEHRRAVRWYPRVRIEFDAIAAGERAKDIQAIFTNNYSDILQLANPGRDKQVNAPVSQDPLAVPGPPVTIYFVGVRPAWIVPGAKVALVKNFDIEIREVQSATDGQMTVTPIAPNLRARQDWPTGTLIQPVVDGYIADTGRIERLTNDTFRIPLAFEVLPGPHSWVQSGQVFPMINGRELFKWRPNWDRSVDTEFRSAREYVDYDFGPIGVHTPWQYREERTEASFLFTNRDEMFDIVAFFVRHHGRWKSFRMPSDEVRINFHRVANEASSYGRRGIVAGDHAFVDRYSGDNPGVLAIHRRDGGTTFREIDNIQKRAEADEGVIITTTDLPDSFFEGPDMDYVEAVSFAPLVRFASDELEMNLLTENKAEARIAFQKLKG